MHKNTLKKPKSQYTLTLSHTHKTRKHYSSSYAAATRVLGITLLFFSLCILPFNPNLIYIYIYIYIIGRLLLGIIFLVEFGLLVTDFGLVAIQATHTAHFNRHHPSWFYTNQEEEAARKHENVSVEGVVVVSLQKAGLHGTHCTWLLRAEQCPRACYWADSVWLGFFASKQIRPS